MATKITNFEMYLTPGQLNNAQQSCLNKFIKKDDCDSDSTSVESSTSSMCSFSSSDLMEDATSPSSSSTSSNGPLFQLSDLMDKLPIKRGLSMYYQGKSESFTSLANVESLEDLAKREHPYNKRIKLCSKFRGGFDYQKFCSSEKKNASNYSRSTSFPSSSFL